MKRIPLTYQKNLRDLGGMETIDGHRIKMGRLYRSGQLHRVSEEDISKINELHLTDIVDFRAESEFLKKGDHPFPGVQQHNFPALDEDFQTRHIPAGVDAKNNDFNLLSHFSITGFEGEAWMKGLYFDLVTSEKAIAAYRDFFSLLVSKDDGVFLWHCSQGKDRAGLAAYFVEIALGVSEQDAKEDYLLTQEAMEDKIEQLKPIVLSYSGNNNIDLAMKNLRTVFSARECYLETAIGAINDTYGSLEFYLKNVLKVDFDRLKSLYID